MLYFDLRPSLKRLSIEDKGLLFEAILDYAELGVLPELDGIVAVAWDFIQPRIDKDRERYDEISRKRTDAINKRWEQEKAIQLNTNDTNEYTPIQAIPTTTTTSNSKSTSTSSSTTVSEGGMEGGELFVRPKEPAIDTPADWEHRKRSALERFNSYFGKATREAVVEYALSHGRTEQDASSFYEYYSERGWTCHGKPIDDWRGLFSRWKKRSNDEGFQDTSVESELDRLMRKHSVQTWDGSNEHNLKVFDNGGSLYLAFSGNIHVFPEEWLYAADLIGWTMEQFVRYVEQEMGDGRAYPEIAHELGLNI